LLNPLDAQHHLRSDDVSIPFREGVVLDKPTKPDRGSLCDVGLEKELELEDKIQLPAATRVTVEITNLGETKCCWFLVAFLELTPRLRPEEALTETRAEEAFDRLVNSLPNKGTNSERVEENVFITLAEVTMRLQQLCSQ
ncbi:hypothetical protein OSTOST_13503, partial [Ostertagia ostertagi]